MHTLVLTVALSLSVVILDFTYMHMLLWYLASDLK